MSSEKQTSQHGAGPSLPRHGADDVPNTNAVLPFNNSHANLHPEANQPSQPIGSDEAFYDIFNDPEFDPAWFDLEPSDFYGDSAASCGFIPSVPNIVDEVDRGDILQSIEPDTATSPASGLGFYSDKYAFP